MIMKQSYEIFCNSDKLSTDILYSVLGNNNSQHESGALMFSLLHI